MPETMSDTPDQSTPGGEDSGLPMVRVTIEVAGLKEVWEFPLMTSALQSALAAIGAVQMELNSRHQMAQQLEREFGEDGVEGK